MCAMLYLVYTDFVHVYDKIILEINLYMNKMNLIHSNESHILYRLHKIIESVHYKVYKYIIVVSIPY